MPQAAKKSTAATATSGTSATRAGNWKTPANAPFPSTWQISKSPQEAPDREEQVQIEFEKGIPVGVNGMRLDPVSLVELLNEIGGRNAIGRVDIVENRFVGIKSRGCYETPGGTLLITAHRELEALCCERDVMHFKQHIALKYAELTYYGLWFTPLREALDAFVASTQQEVTGTVTLSLYKGNVSVVSRQSDFSLYRTDLSSFTMGESYDQKDAAGFIRILGLPSRSRARSRAEGKGEAREVRSDANENVVGPLPPASRPRVRELAAVVRIRLPIAGVRAGGQFRARPRPAPMRSSVRRRTWSPCCKASIKSAKMPRLRTEFVNDPEAEDIHHFVEKQLVKIIGDPGYKLHSGRSRNEQIATDLRLYVRAGCDEIGDAISKLISAFLERAEKAGTAAMPAYTHLQRAEPVLVAHWLLAYVEMLFRDLDRLADCRKRANLCPLGSAAVAGSTLPLDREHMSGELGFTAPTANSIDATSDRDFVLEFVNALSLLALHLSRWAEEMLLFSSQEYGFLRLPEAYSTGSSAMPQKMNGDLLELTRGKAGRVIGDATSLLITMKGLPLAYNKDLQETQEPLFHATETVISLLPLVTGWMESVEFNFERMQKAADTGYMNAFAAATYLVRKGVPFRIAHEQVGKAVRAGSRQELRVAGPPARRAASHRHALCRRLLRLREARQRASNPRRSRRHRACARRPGHCSRPQESRRTARGGPCTRVKLSCPTPSASTT